MKKILFLHHSVGRYIVQHGALRERLRALASDGSETVELWDHDYNKFGLTDGNGHRLERAFPIPNDNTDPDGFVSLFRTAAAEPDSDLATGMRGYDLVMIKSCYPNNAIRSDAQLESLKQTYMELFQLLRDRPDDAFLILTSPPLAPARTNRDSAKRAQVLAEWLCASVRPNNVDVFDLYSLLSGPRGTLKREFRRLVPLDSHPNRDGCSAAAEALTERLAALVAPPQPMDRIGG